MPIPGISSFCQLWGGITKTGTMTEQKNTETKSGGKKSVTIVEGATPTSVSTSAVEGAAYSAANQGASYTAPTQQMPRVLSQPRAADSMVLSGAEVTVKTLLEAGAHFGHQTQRWNPRMSPYIFGDRNGIHIINLDASVALWGRARKFVVDTVAAGGAIMFVGTKQQCREIIQEEATRCGAYFVTDRWLGGTMSNFTTIRAAIERMNKLEELVKSAETEGSKVKIVKKERVRIYKELDKLQKSLGGIRDMKRLPQIMFIVDLVKEEIAVAEARKLNIPVVGVVDTNADPSRISFPIPSNDDAPKVCRLLTAAIADAVIEGKRLQTNDHSAQHAGGFGGGGNTPRGKRGPSRGFGNDRGGNDRGGGRGGRGSGGGRDSHSRDSGKKDSGSTGAAEEVAATTEAPAEVAPA